MHEYTLLAEARAREARESWERDRWRIWWQMNLSPLIRPGSRPGTPEALFRFPWEKGPTGERNITSSVTEEEAAALDAALAEYRRINGIEE